MSTIDMTQVAGIQAVNAEGKVIGTLSVDDLTELVATKIVQEAKNEAVSARSASVMSEASTLAATDEYEDQLELDTNPAYVRSLDSEGNPKLTATTSLATVVGGLIPTVTSSKNGLFPKFSSVPKMGSAYKLSYSQELWWNGSSFGQGLLYLTIRNSTGETAKSALYILSAAKCSKVAGDDLPITFSRVNSYNVKLISNSPEEITLSVLALNASSNE